MTSSKSKLKFPALVTLGGCDPSASEYLASKRDGKNRDEERRILEHLAYRFAGTPRPPPLWPKVGLRRFKVDLDQIPWSRITPEQAREIGLRQYDGLPIGPVRAEDEQSPAPGEPLRRRPVRRPPGHGVARRRVFALRQIFKHAHGAGRMPLDHYLEVYGALRGL